MNKEKKQAYTYTKKLNIDQSSKSSDSIKPKQAVLYPELEVALYIYASPCHDSDPPIPFSILSIPAGVDRPFDMMTQVVPPQNILCK